MKVVDRGNDDELGIWSWTTVAGKAGVNPSGKASAQIPQLPLGDNSSPWGDNATCTGAHTGYTAGSAKSLSATYQ
jgi:hypothetical protein